MAERGARRPVFEDSSGRRARRVRLLVLPLLVAVGAGGALAFASVTAPMPGDTVNALPLSTPSGDQPQHPPFAVSVVERPAPGPPAPCRDLSGVVFNDHDRNGARQANEPGVAGLAVGALGQDGALVAETLTSTDGRWAMTLRSAQIVRLVTWSPNRSMHPAPRGVDSEPWASSPAPPKCGAELAMVWDEGSSTAPGLPMELGDLVWSDDDCDGWQDPLESGLVAISVRLYDGDGRRLAETLTNSAGEYLFGGLHPDRVYRVEIVFDGAYSPSPRQVWTASAITGADHESPSAERARLQDAFRGSDSDGVPTGPAQAAAEWSAPITGASDHSVDFGLAPLGTATCAPAVPPTITDDPSATQT